jgi:hypothetical protein
MLEETIQLKGWAVHHREEPPYYWEVRELRLLVGLRAAALVSLYEEHGWEKPVAEAFLDKWLASSASEVSTYLSCLNTAALQELTHRVMNAKEANHGQGQDTN